jgi:GT2 family glycosyltransferase
MCAPVGDFSDVAEVHRVKDIPRTLASLTTDTRPVLDDITVVIPTLGRPILQESLSWMIEGSVWPAGLVVVDQGTNPEVAGWIEILRSLGINADYVPSSQRGRATGLNRGLGRVRTRFVAVTDDDCFVATDWLEKMTTRLRDAPYAIVTGRVEPAGNGVIVVVTSPVSAIYRRPRLKFDTMSGGNMGTSTDVIQHVGPFDEDPRLRTAEDGEWSYRALRAGVPIIYAPEVVVRHFGWRNDSRRSAQYKDYARSQGGFYGKYLRQGDWFIALRALVHLARALRWWLRGIVNGDRELASFGHAYLTGLLPGILAGIRRRKSF